MRWGLLPLAGLPTRRAVPAGVRGSRSRPRRNGFPVITGLLLALTLIVLAACTEACNGEPPADSAEVVEQPAAEPQVTFDINVTPESPMVGDEVTITVAAAFPEGSGDPSYSIFGELAPILVPVQGGEDRGANGLWTLLAAEPGAVTATIRANYEAAFTRPDGGIYYGYTISESAPFTINVGPAPTAAGTGEALPPEKEGFPIPEKEELENPELDTALDELASRIEAGEITEEEAAEEAPVSRGKTVAVTIYLSENVDGVVEFLAEHDVTPRHVGEDYIEAFVPVRLLRQISKMTGVLIVETIVPPESSQQPPMVGPGASVHGALEWNAAGFTGRGIKVGIIDVGFVGFEDLMGSELPETVKARCYGVETDGQAGLEGCEGRDHYEGGSNHGTIVAESVIDLAPDVSLYIGVPRTRGDLGAIVEWMTEEEVSVINMSLAWSFEGPGDGTSPYSNSVQRSVDRAVGNGIVWVNSAGNYAQGAWYGVPSDVDGDGILEFGDLGEKLQVSPGRWHWYQLRWQGGWENEDLDLDLYAYHEDGSVANRSLYPQKGERKHRAFEHLYGREGVFLEVGNRGDSLPGWMQILSFSGRISQDTGGSLTVPAEGANPGMLAVGAAPWNNTDTIEGFSSRGPAPDGRSKPDLVGADCGPTRLSERFCGTSQSSPHVAGMAALVRQRFPDFTPQEVAQYLTDNTEERGAPGWDTTWGHGFAMLPSPMAAGSPDLAVDAPTVSGGGPTAGESFTLRATVHNQGGAESAATTLRYYRSTDSTITTSDASIGTDDVRSMDASGSSPETISLTAPSEVGTHYYGACVDAVTGESDTANNCSAAVRVTVGAAASPDLEVDTPEVSGSPTVGTPFTLSVTVRNRGDGTSAPTTLRFYRSTDSTIGPRDTEVGTDPVSNLSPSGRSGIARGILAPSEAGTYYYGACVDAVAGESDTDNNCSTAVRVTVGAAASPDLVVDALSWESSTGITAGGSFTLSVTVRNRGDGTSAATTLRFYRSTDSTITTSDTSVGTDSVSSLDASGSSWESISLTAPEEAGTYYYGACVDAVAGESNTTNNCSTSVEVTVGAAGEQSDDRAALVALYNATDGPNWTDNTNWLSDRPIGEWYGVTTNANGRVTELKLYTLSERGTLTTNGLNGSLPPELGNLSELERLELSPNSLSGSIPREIGNLTNLEHLSLSSNNLSGSIPRELGSLSNLGFVEIRGNRLTGAIPMELGSLSNLRTLDLTSNSLSGSIPPELGGLTNLRYLSVASNDLSGTIPSELGNLSNLTVLGLGSNSLSGPIPSEVGDLSNLEDLSLGSNNLAGSLPQELGSLANLNSLWLDSNQLTGALPRSLTNLSLDFFYFGDNAGLCAPTGTAFQRWLQGIDDHSGPNCSTPDLAVNAPTVSDSSPTAGARFTLRAEVRNQGGAQSATTTLRYYRSTDSAITASDASVGTDSVGALAASGSSAETINVTAPSEAGTYYYGACVDAVTGEGDTANNCSTAVRVTVGAAISPDLVVIGPTVDNSSPTAGTSFTLSVDVRNRGNGPSASTDVRFYRSTDSTIRSGDTQVGTDDVRGLDAHEISAESVSLTAPSETGTYYYGACVDAVADESATTNNCSTAVQVTVGAAAAPVSPDRAALVALYNATDGPNWTNRTNWLSDRPIGEWYGVTTNGSGRVTGLELRDDSQDRDGNGLNGRLPRELADLSELGKLSITDNSELRGPIPGELGTLSNLIWLGLHYNQLSGQIPRELGSLSNLIFLGLGPNDLNGPIPRELGNLSNLRWLSLGRNSLSGPIPRELGNLSNMELLYFDENQLRGVLPDSLTNLPLDDFRFGENAGLCAPTDAAFQTWLQGIDSHSGPNCAAPDLVVRAPEVSDGSPTAGAEFTLEVEVYNQGSAESESTDVRFYRSTDSTIGSSDTQVDTDDVRGLDPTGSSAESARLTAPSEPGTYYYGACVDAVADESDTTNNCSTAVRVTVGAAAPVSPDRAALVALYNATDGPNWVFNDNWLSERPIGEWYGVTTNANRRVTALGLYTLDGNVRATNGLRGPIPSELGNLSKLERLEFGNNQLTGSIPRELGNLSNLETLDLYRNQLSGPIPREFGNLTNLEYLALTSNNLSGPIPREMGNLSKLEYLYLNDNNLTGPIPRELGNLSKLTRMRVDNNPLSGSIPRELGNLSNLELLYLNSNNLSGPIPSELGNLSNLTQLFLIRNNLSGPIPHELGDLSNLEELRVHRNQLTGALPGSLTDLSLDRFEFGENAGLCAPTDAAFQRWLQGIDDHRGPNCSAPDLVVRAPEVSSPTAGAVAEFTLSAEVYNQGSADSESTDIRFYLSTDSTIGTGDTQVATDDVRSLDPTGSSRESVRLTAPSEAGTYYYGACVDAVAGESDTDNNCSTAVRVTVEVVETPTPAPSADRDALVALYNATGGSQWEANTNWLSDRPLDEWYGVTLNDSGRVTGLDLRGNWLEGELPAELGSLSALRELELWGNSIYGSIPSQLGNLGSTLNTLNLGGDFQDLTGCIPAGLRDVPNNDLDELGLPFCG